MTEWNDESHDLLDDLIRRLEAAWRNAGDADLAQFVPAADHPHAHTGLGDADPGRSRTPLAARAAEDSLEEYLAEWPEIAGKPELRKRTQGSRKESPKRGRYERPARQAAQCNTLATTSCWSRSARVAWASFTRPIRSASSDSWP